MEGMKIYNLCYIKNCENSIFASDETSISKIHNNSVRLSNRMKQFFCDATTQCSTEKCFNTITTWHLEAIVAIRQVRLKTGMDFQVYSNWVNFSAAPLAVLSWRVFFNTFLKGLIGFRLDDWSGQSMRVTLRRSNQCLIARESCLGTLSCWKRKPRPMYALAYGSIIFAKTSLYISTFIMPATKFRGRTADDWNQHRSRTNPPQCFSVESR